MKKTLYLVRHGDVDARPGIFLGTTDVDLDERGRQQSFWLAEQLAAIPFDRCFCSPLLRAQHTATGIITKNPVKIEIHDALREIHFGLWEGRCFSEIEIEEPQQAAAWCRNPLSFVFPQGDVVAQFCQRLETYLEWLKGGEGETILLVTHGGVIRVLLALLLQLDPQQQFIFQVDRGSVTVVKIFDSSAVLCGLNQRMDGCYSE